MLLFIDSAAEITALNCFKGGAVWGVCPISTAGIRGMTSCLHKSLKWLFRRKTQLEMYLNKYQVSYMFLVCFSRKSYNTSKMCPQAETVCTLGSWNND